MRKAIKQITLLIADDHPLFRRGLRDSIEEVEYINIVAECGNGTVALREIRTLKPDIAILDMEMPEMGGLDVAAVLMSEKTCTKIIFLTVHDDEAMFRRAMHLGAMGYVLKDSVVNEIVQAIEVVNGGDHYISPLMSARLRKDGSSLSKSSANEGPISRLTATERRVLALISDELSSEEIADKLCVSPRTVEHHRSNIKQKLELSGASSLLRFALKNRKYL